MADVSLEERIQLALNGYKKGRFKSINKAALAYDIPRRSLQRQVKGVTRRSNTTANCRKLTDTVARGLTSTDINCTISSAIAVLCTVIFARSIDWREVGESVYQAPQRALL
jgi:hypothetical protein